MNLSPLPCHPDPVLYERITLCGFCAGCRGAHTSNADIYLELDGANDGCDDCGEPHGTVAYHLFRTRTAARRYRP